MEKEIGWQHAWRVLLGSLLLVAFASSVAKPNETDAAAVSEIPLRPVDTRISELLAPHTNRSQLNRAIGTSPYRCVLAGPGSEICSWQTGRRSHLWNPLASALGTTRQLNIICELPTDREPRASDSCVARPREKSGALALDRSTTSLEPDLLAAAGTIREISFLIGDVPWDCSYIGNQERECLWKSSSQTYGHYLIGSMIGSTRKLYLRCVVPQDGSRRPIGSCIVEVGS